MKAVTLSLAFLLASAAPTLCQTAANPEQVSPNGQAPAVSGPETDSRECLQGGSSAFFACLGDDLIDASYFEAGGGISLSDAPTTISESAPGVNVEAEDPARGALTSDAVSTNPTAYIDIALLWRLQDVNDTNNNGLIEIPVCWINSTDGDRQGRELTQQAVRNTWEVHAPIRFTGWTRCQAGATGAVRIRISDENPRSYVGRDAARQPTSMWLNFSFDRWSPVCQNQKGRINWSNCVHSIAVHEFGHLLGYLHEHDRLFHGTAINMLPADQLQQRIAACRRVGVAGPSTATPARQPLITAYDPVSVMNYCFNIYDHQVQLSSFDIAGLQRAYPQ